MNKRSVSVIYDPANPKTVCIGSDDGLGDPWEDLRLLMEGVGILARICVIAGKIEHKDMPIKEYLQGYIGEVCDASQKTFTLVHSEEQQPEHSHD